MTPDSFLAATVFRSWNLSPHVVAAHAGVQSMDPMSEAPVG